MLVAQTKALKKKVKTVKVKNTNSKNTATDNTHDQTANSEGSVIFLKGKKTILRPVAEKDIPLCVRWVNDPKIWIYTTTSFPITSLAEREWYERVAKKSDKDVVFAIETHAGQTIGIMGIHGINWIDRTATTGAIIGEKAFHGKGYGTDAKMTLLNYAFNTLGLRKICSRVIAFNGRSIAYSLHCGYEIEGALHKHVLRAGKYHDLVLLAVFKKGWLPHWKKYKARK